MYIYIYHKCILYIIYNGKFVVCVGGLDYGYLGFPYERDCYLGSPLESQTTDSNHQFTSSWICIYMYLHIYMYLQIFIYMYTYIHLFPSQLHESEPTSCSRSLHRGSRVFQGGFGTWRDMAKSVLLGQLWKENTQRLVDLCSYSRFCF